MSNTSAFEIAPARFYDLCYSGCASPFLIKPRLIWSDLIACVALERFQLLVNFRTSNEEMLTEVYRIISALCLTVGAGIFSLKQPQ